ncbi:GntR family transcriptional regulator [Burkholderia sp. BCC1998]|uniref:GntR family transcriptional regulator n=1 Tax=Burkholderia sp. BCC1998 TaxID=2817447 RepID=UPI002AB6296A|nr:GntR family transcriptional regulator [Burkholderia sp. BCC1998]
MNHDDPGFDDSKETHAQSQTVKALLGMRELVLSGELAPRTRISELWVVERLNVSRTPVRAALIRLHHEGLLEQIPSGGFAVRSFEESEICDSIELRGTLEGLAARLAAERGVEASVLDALQMCVAQIDEVLATKLNSEKFSQYVEINRQFHKLLAQASGSAVVCHQIEQVMHLPFASASAFIMVQSIDDDARDMLLLAQAQHRAVVDALVRREGTRAESLMREHSRIAQQNLQLALHNHKAMAQLLGGNLIRLRERSTE